MLVPGAREGIHEKRHGNQVLLPGYRFDRRQTVWVSQSSRYAGRGRQITETQRQSTVPNVLQGAQSSSSAS